MPLLVKGVYDTRVEAKTQMTALKRTKSKDKDLLTSNRSQQSSCSTLSTVPWLTNISATPMWQWQKRSR
jgi:hypothetical protein